MHDTHHGEDMVETEEDANHRKEEEGKGKDDLDKKKKVERHHYEPYIKNSFLSKLTRVFPFRFLRDEYAPLMKLIMKYFICEERFPASMPITSSCSCTSPGCG